MRFLSLRAALAMASLASAFCLSRAAWADATLDEPIIWIGQYDSTVINYENAYIQYMVYDPQADVFFRTLTLDVIMMVFN